MERVIIAFQNSHINNFFCLPIGTVINDKKVVFINDPNYDFVDGKVETNFDYLITDGSDNFGINTKLHELLPKEKLVVIPRYSKVVQSVRFNNHIDLFPNKYPHFYNPKIYKNRNLVTQNFSVPGNTKVVIKPTNGARGIGQFLIDTGKVPFKVVHELVHTFNQCNIDSDKLFKELEPWGDGVIYSKGTEHRENEGLDMLKSEYMIQEYVPSLISEYRLITDYKGDIAYCQRRTLREKTPGYKQAIGSEVLSKERDDIVSDFSNMMFAKEIQSFIKSVIGPMNSVDLFYTMDKKWGIFEHCNQFGMAGVPDDIAIKLHVDFIANLIK